MKYTATLLIFFVSSLFDRASATSLRRDLSVEEPMATGALPPNITINKPTTVPIIPTGHGLPSSSRAGSITFSIGAEAVDGILSSTITTQTSYIFDFSCYTDATKATRHTLIWLWMNEASYIAMNADEDFSYYATGSCIAGCSTFTKSFVMTTPGTYYLVGANVDATTGVYCEGDTAQYTTTSFDSSSSSGVSSCFSGEDKIMVRGGLSKRMADLAVGDEVLTLSQGNALEFSPVVYLPHVRNHVPSLFAEIHSESGAVVSMTADHLVVSSPNCHMSEPFDHHQLGKHLVPAGSLNASHCLLVAHEDELHLEKIVDIQLVHREGIYTAVTKNPYLVVNGVVASPFALYHDLPHTFYHFIRLVYEASPNAVHSTWVTSIMSGISALVDSALTLTAKA